MYTCAIKVWFERMANSLAIEQTRQIDVATSTKERCLPVIQIQPS